MMTAAPVKPDAKSPYQKYGKAPTLYSPEYQRWFAAVKKNDDRATREAHTDWMRRFR
jgi:hypothetical protein